MIEQTGGARRSAGGTTGFLVWPASRPVSMAGARAIGLLTLAALLALTACKGPSTPGFGDLRCRDEPAGSVQPTLECSSEEAGVTLSIPWQGNRLAVRALPQGHRDDLPHREGFRPLSERPLIRLAVTNESTGRPVRQFDPPLQLSVDYGSSEFDAAEPLVESGELGLGSWDRSGQSLLVVGHGVFESGFWVADPRIGQANLRLAPNALERLPRFAMTGSTHSGKATALIAEAPATIAPVWGAMPADMGHMMVGFDPCEESENSEGIVRVQCTSSDGAVTVRVPYQEGGSVRPKVIALPWNLDETVQETESHPASMARESVSEYEPVHDRTLMNFLVVDADDPQTVLTSFDPPMEFEIAYTADDISLDPEVPQLLSVNYWDEELETLVVLGAGDPYECFDHETGGASAGCLWGEPVEAMPVEEMAFPEHGVAYFFRMDDSEGNGRARFLFDRWGDRMVAFGR